MLLGGINHVAILTGDTERFVEFYPGVFDAKHDVLQERDGFRLTVVWIGPTAELNVFELRGNTEHILSLFFRDPDGLEAEVCVANPDAQPGVFNPPGTPSRRYHDTGTPPPERLSNSPLRPKSE